MSETVEVNGEKYDLSNNPSLGTVREIQGMQMDLIRDHVSEEDLMEMDSLEDEGQIIQSIIENEGWEGFEEVKWERSMLEPVQTISLACDERFQPSDFDEMGARDFKELRQKAEDELNGSAMDFFEELGIGLNLTEEQMEKTGQTRR